MNGLIMKISNKQDFQQIPINHSSDIDLKDFMTAYGNCTAKPYLSYKPYCTTLPLGNPLRFRQNLLK